MNLLFQAAKEVCDFAGAQGWRYCVIGGLAVQRWGEPRTTLDVDLSLLTGFGHEEEFARPLLEHFRGRIPHALDFALAHRVLLISAANGKDVDIAFAALPFEHEMMDRASAFEFAPGVELVTCSAEDLFIMKTFAGRTRDWLDAEGMAIRLHDSLDKTYVLKHLAVLSEVKEDPIGPLFARQEALSRATLQQLPRLRRSERRAMRSSRFAVFPRIGSSEHDSSKHWKLLLLLCAIYCSLFTVAADAATFYVWTNSPAAGRGWAWAEQIRWRTRTNRRPVRSTGWRYSCHETEFPRVGKKRWGFSRDWKNGGRHPCFVAGGIAGSRQQQWSAIRGRRGLRGRDESANGDDHSHA